MKAYNSAAIFFPFTDLLVAEVAEQAGFSTPQRMATVFRQLTGVAPGDYRRQTRVRGQPLC